MLSVLCCIILIGCSSATLIKDVPYNLKSGHLYLTSKTVEIAGREYAAEEGFLVVNENPTDTLSRKNQLPVLRIRSAGKNPGEPIFWLNGGPGQSNMNYSHLSSLLENHDFVLVGYRGVDGSIVLQSEEVKEALEGVDGDLLSDTSLHSLSKTLESFSKNLETQGVDLSHYTMVDVVSDLEAARKAFRYEKIDLLSLSYGTRVALIYGCLHPAVVFRSAMIAVNPPGHFTWSPKKIDEQLAYYDRLFAADSGRYDGRPLSQSIRTALAKMPSRWSLFKLDPGKIRVITFAMLYRKQSAALVFDCYRAAEQGDYSGLYMLQRAYDFMMPSMMIWGDLFAKGSTDFDPDIDYRSSMRDSTTIMGSPFSLLIAGSAAGHWPVHRLPPELNKVQRSDVQTLLISGSVDFSTPAEYAAEELLPSLANGKQVILREMGHVGDVLNLQRPALEHLLVRFYDEGVADDSKFKYDPMDFDPQINFPLCAKVLYPFILILSAF
jgi:pimeloyl-ACP methyl ester carboxylesterase